MSNKSGRTEFTSTELAMNIHEFSEYLKSGKDGKGKCTLTLRPPKQKHSEPKPSKPIHRRPKHKTVREYRLQLSQVEAVQRFMEDHVVDSTLVKSVLDKFAQLYTEHKLPDNGGGVMYTWNSGCKKVQFRFSTKTIHLFITALVECMPEPVQKIRNELLHGSDVQFEFDGSVRNYMRCAMKFCTPYMERKISQHERQITGRVFERALYRTTDNGQGGRRFSDADVADIMSRVSVLVFCPLYCRMIPITDKGRAYIAVRSSTVRRWIGTRTFTIRRGNRGMTVLWDTIKKFRENKITEQEYNKFLSEFSAKTAKVVTEQDTKTGFWIEWTCEQTGQRFTTFTQSAGRAEQLASMTAFCGEGEQEFRTDGEPMFMEPNTIFSYRMEGRFFRTLKHITRNLFRYLFRRTEHDDSLITEHRSSLLARKSHRIHDFSLNDLMSRSSLLTPEQLDVIATELTYPDELPKNVDRREKRVQQFRDLVTERIGSVPDITRHEYSELRKKCFEDIAYMLEQDAPELLFNSEADLVGQEFSEINAKAKLVVQGTSKKVYTVDIGKTVEHYFTTIPYSKGSARWAMSTNVYVGKYKFVGWQTDLGYCSVGEFTGAGDGV